MFRVNAIALMCAMILLVNTVNAAEKCTIPEGEWVDLLPTGDVFNYWQEPLGEWVSASKVFVKEGDAKALDWEPGEGEIVNGPKGRTEHLRTNFNHGDIEAHIEFMVPQGSNSGVYFMARYEIQILDSWGVEKPGYGDCPEWHLIKPLRIYLDAGIL